MKQKFVILLLLGFSSLLSSVSIAWALKQDYLAKKAGKNVAMKATIGVSGRCASADAARDSAKDFVENDGNDKGKDSKATKGVLKKVIK